MRWGTCKSVKDGRMSDLLCINIRKDGSVLLGRGKDCASDLQNLGGFVRLGRGARREYACEVTCRTVVPHVLVHVATIGRIWHAPRQSSVGNATVLYWYVLCFKGIQEERACYTYTEKGTCFLPSAHS